MSAIPLYIQTKGSAAAAAAESVPVVGSLSVVDVNGSPVATAATPEGHIEVEVHGPRLPFGAVHTEKLRPVFQLDAVYGYTSGEVRQTTSLSGACTAANNLFTVATGATQFAFATIQSRRRLRYRPGQGIVCRFTGIWPANAASSILVAGVGTGESGVFFGYNGTSFGVLHSTGGVREIRTLTITTKSSTAENITVTLNGTGFSVPVTNGATTVTTAHEIAQATFTGWTAEASGSTVVFLRNSVGPTAGAYSVAGTTVVGSFATTLTGVASTDTWVPQADWNGDTLDGNGPTGFTLNPARGNVFQINTQYLGFGVTTLLVETTSDTNNPTWTTAHTFKFPNTRTTPIFSQPSFPFTLAAYSAGSTTNLSVSTASTAGFIEGDIYLTGPRLTARATSTAVGSAAIRPLFTIRNNSVYAGRANQSVIYLRSVNAAVKHTQPAEIFLIRNAVLTGANFAAYAATSPTFYDNSATALTFADNSQLVWSGSLAETGGAAEDFADDITLQPGETFTLAARTTTGTASYVSGGLTWREDQ